MHLMSSTKQAISAMELGRRPGLGHATAWYLHKRLRHAMSERNERSRIGGGGGPPGPDKGQPAAASPPAQPFIPTACAPSIPSARPAEARAHQPLLHPQHPDRQPQHGAQGHLQALLSQASARLSRRLLLDYKPPPLHARHGRCPLSRRCLLFPPHTQPRLLCLTGQFVDKREEFWLVWGCPTTSTVDTMWTPAPRNEEGRSRSQHATN